MFLAERSERDVERDFFLFGEDAKVVEGGAVNFAFPAFERAAVDGEGLVGEGEAVVDVDDAAEAPALGTGPERGVEGEEGGRSGAEGATGRGGMKAAGIVPGGR